MADTADTDTEDTMANTANILAQYRREAGATSAAAHRENIATGPAETGEAVIGTAIGGIAVTGAAAADSSLSAEVIRTTGIGTHIRAGAILTRTTAIILRMGTHTTVAPYQDTDTFGANPSWFPAPASPAIVPAESKRLNATSGCNPSNNSIAVSLVLTGTTHQDKSRKTG